MTFISEIASDIAKDCGYQAVANQVQIFGKLSVLVISFPVFTELISSIGKLLLWENYCKDEYFVRVLENSTPPETRWVEGSNFVDVSFKVDERTGRIIMMGAMDNLVKGAAGQAVQNMNIMFGLPENEGLQQVPMFP